MIKIKKCFVLIKIIIITLVIGNVVNCVHHQNNNYLLTTNAFKQVNNQLWRKKKLIIINKTTLKYSLSIIIFTVITIILLNIIHHYVKKKAIKKRSSSLTINKNNNDYLIMFALINDLQILQKKDFVINEKLKLLIDEKTKVEIEKKIINNQKEKEKEENESKLQALTKIIKINDEINYLNEIKKRNNEKIKTINKQNKDNVIKKKIILIDQFTIFGQLIKKLKIIVNNDHLDKKVKIDEYHKIKNELDDFFILFPYKDDEETKKIKNEMFSFYQWLFFFDEKFMIKIEKINDNLDDILITKKELEANTSINDNDQALITFLDEEYNFKNFMQASLKNYFFDEIFETIKLINFNEIMLLDNVKLLSIKTTLLKEKNDHMEINDEHEDDKIAKQIAKQMTKAWEKWQQIFHQCFKKLVTIYDDENNENDYFKLLDDREEAWQQMIKIWPSLVKNKSLTLVDKNIALYDDLTSFFIKENKTSLFIKESKYKKRETMITFYKNKFLDDEKKINDINNENKQIDNEINKKEKKKEALIKKLTTILIKNDERVKKIDEQWTEQLAKTDEIETCDKFEKQYQETITEVGKEYIEKLNEQPVLIETLIKKQMEKHFDPLIEKLHIEINEKEMEKEKMLLVLVKTDERVATKYQLWLNQWQPLIAINKYIIKIQKQMLDIKEDLDDISHLNYRTLIKYKKKMAKKQEQLSTLENKIAKAKKQFFQIGQKIKTKGNEIWQQQEKIMIEINNEYMQKINEQPNEMKKEFTERLLKLEEKINQSFLINKILTYYFHYYDRLLTTSTIK